MHVISRVFFFFKQKTAYEMLRSLVGSEMCRRDRVYRANSVLLVESSQIPGALAAPTVQAQALEKLQTIENRLMTRTNLLDIAQRLEVFKDMAKMTPDDIVGAMRKNTRITKSAGRGQATIMTVEFEGESGPVVAGVVNEYVTLILNEDVATRTERAETTVDFFDQEVKRLSGELDAMSAKILDFQNQNADALPNTGLLYTSPSPRVS